MNIAIVGATGLAGRELLRLIRLRSFHYDKMRLFASDRSAGTFIECDGKNFDVEGIGPSMFDGINIAFFAVDAKLARELAPVARAAGTLVIDKSSAFRMDPNVPLIIPEINGDMIDTRGGIIASPNCSTTVMLMGLWPLHWELGLTRIIVSTYQSMSGGGAGLLEKFHDQVRNQVAASIRGVDLPNTLFDNVIPVIDSIDADGWTGEERKMVDETRKILGLPYLPISATCVRVPVSRGHSMSVNAEFGSWGSVDVAEARRLVSNFGNGIRLMDDSSIGYFPMPSNTVRQEYCGVGRIRKDPTCANGLVLWISGDNLWKGAALNALQIAERIIHL